MGSGQDTNLPRVTQYIREEDYEAWQAIENKSEWIHERLNKRKFTPPERKEVLNTLGPETPPKKDAVVKGSNLCKIHGTPLTINGRCLQKGCKYA